MTGKPTDPAPPSAPDRDDKRRRAHQEDILDEALDESFPASDPLPVDPGVEKQ